MSSWVFISVSLDLRVSGCYGLFVPGTSPAQVTMAALDHWTTVAVEIAHTRSLDETRGAAIQVGGVIIIIIIILTSL